MKEDAYLKYLNYLTDKLHESQIKIDSLNNKIGYIESSNTYKLSLALKKMVRLVAPEDTARRNAIRFIINSIRAKIRRRNTATDTSDFAPIVERYEPLLIYFLLNIQPEINILCSIQTVFVAKLIQAELNSLGKHCHIYTNNDHIEYTDELYFIICPQVFSQLPRNYIVYQLEQSVSSRWFTKEYWSILHNALSIFDYSQDNILYLENNGIPMKKIFYLPIGHIPLGNIGNNSNEKLKDKKIIFYGDDKSERRTAMLSKLQESFEICIINNLYGDELYDILKNAYLVLNINYYDNSLLETVRLQECLSLGVPVVSEASHNMYEYDSDLIECITFFRENDVNDAISIITNIINSTELYNQICEKTIKYMNQDELHFSFYFKRFLLAYDAIDFYPVSDLGCRIFEKKVAAEGIQCNNLCLVLPEAVDRKRLFLNHKYDFIQIEGLRHYIGWIGCGLSYKHIANFAKSMNNDIIVCEDDVDFPDNYDEGIKIVKEYLTLMEGQWDMFIGFITDIIPETKILRIDCYKGREFIYFDKACSAVFNIYSKRIRDKIITWDYNNRVSANVSDRFYNDDGYKFVMTYPYFVGHAADLCSTNLSELQSQKNSDIYDEITKQSSLRLEEKIREFKSTNKVNNIG